MKIIDLVPYLKNEETFKKFYGDYDLNLNSECILVYMKDSINLDSEIKFFEIETTNDEIEYERDGINYIQLFPLNLGVEIYSFFESEFTEKKSSLVEKANRIIEYRINNA